MKKKKWTETVGQFCSFIHRTNISLSIAQKLEKMEDYRGFVRMENKHYLVITTGRVGTALGSRSLLVLNLAYRQ